MKTQYGDLLRTDVSENSMTFKIEGDMVIKAGRYAIVPVENDKEYNPICNHPKDRIIDWHDSSMLCSKCNCIIEQYGEKIIPPCPL